MTGERGGGPPTADEDDVTIDTLLRGRVTLVQPARGFRSSIDLLLLAAFIRPPFGRFVDIGCGTGALAFALAAIDPEATGVAVEIQPRLARLAARGLARNAFATRLALVEADVRQAAGGPSLPEATFDLVATNPPYRAVGGGFVSPDGERARANHEVTLKLAEWLDAAAALVRTGGLVAAVFVAARHDELLAQMRARALAPRRLRFVHARLDEAPSRILVEAVRVDPGERPPAGEPVVEPPLLLRGPNGHSEEVRAMLGET